MVERLKRHGYGQGHSLANEVRALRAHLARVEDGDEHGAGSSGALPSASGRPGPTRGGPTCGYPLGRPGRIGPARGGRYDDLEQALREAPSWFGGSADFP